MTIFWDVAAALAAIVVALLFIYGGAKLATAGILQARQDFEARRKALGLVNHNEEH